MKKYIIYKVTNKVNNKIYIGQHQTEDIDDNYMGSGLLLNRAIEKYGISNFSKEVLFSFDTKEEMNEMEKYIVDEEFVERNDTYNLTIGGYGGGFHFANKHGLNNKKGQCYRIIEMLKDPEYEEEFKRKVSETVKEYFDKNGHNWVGKKHKEETKCKIGEANAKHQIGKGNSNYGNCWIYNEDLKENRLVKKEHLQDNLKDGWKKGRKIKF